MFLCTQIASQEPVRDVAGSHGTAGAGCVDVEPDARGCRGVEEGVEGGHPRHDERAAEPRAGIQRRDLGGGPLADGSPARRGPIERAVVEEHEGPVACGPHVELDVVGPKGQGLPERFQRVLGDTCNIPRDIDAVSGPKIDRGCLSTATANPVKEMTADGRARRDGG